MQADAEVSCPYCGQSSTMIIDTSVASQQFTTDCEVCCRPFRVSVECEAGEILSIDAQSE
jgi:hypothetical protein